MHGPNYFILAIGCFILIAILLVVYILVYVYVKNNKAKKQIKWANMANLLIRKAIFAEEAQEYIPVTNRLQKTLSKTSFREFLTDELIKARKNVSGIAAENVKNLYLQLNLDKYALNGLKSYKWHIKAQKIQELSIIGLKEHIDKLYPFTNDKNNLVRIEAQTAVVKFSGYDGLKFLDTVTYPIDEWQQIKLLQELSGLPPDNFTGIETWLQSSNKTVVIFALKLVQNYHKFELHNLVAGCLNHPDADVKQQAIITLGDIYNEKTPDLLISKFLRFDMMHQIAIIKVFKNIASEKEIPFLTDQLDHKNAEVVLQAARALAKIGPEGVKVLTNYRLADQYPLNEIIKQVKNELAI